MPMVRAMRLLNAIEAGTTTGAQLQALLTSDPGRLGEWNALLVLRGQCRRLAASGTALAAITGSAVAMAAVVNSPVAMAAIDASDKATRFWMLAGTGQDASTFANVAAVVASATAMAAIVASSVALSAIAASASSIAAVAASATAMATIAASSAAMLAMTNSPAAVRAFAASSTAMAAINTSETSQALRIWLLAGTGQAYTSFASVYNIAASSTAMAAITTSASAMAAMVELPNVASIMVDSETARNRIAQSPLAMRAVANSATFMGVAANATHPDFLSAAWAINIAREALRTSAVAMGVLLTSKYLRTYSGTPSSTFGTPIAHNERALLLRSKTAGPVRQNHTLQGYGTILADSASSRYTFIPTEAYTTHMLPFIGMRFVATESGKSTQVWTCDVLVLGTAT